MAVHEHHAGEAVGRPSELDDHGGQGLGADRERARERGVLAGGAVGEGRRDHHVGTGPGQRRGQGTGDAGVGVEGEVRPVLLEAAEGYDEQLLPVGTDLGPRPGRELGGVHPPIVAPAAGPMAGATPRSSING